MCLNVQGNYVCYFLSATRYSNSFVALFMFYNNYNNFNVSDPKTDPDDSQLELAYY